MKVEWNYTNLAAFYDKRADYSSDALAALYKIMNLNEGFTVADVGAGTGKLTNPLLSFGLQVKAVEPNDEMRAFGIRNTEGKTVEWTKATGENTGLDSNSVQAFCMGSSFNVVDQELCLKEASRVLASKGWFACMWNHRDLQDELQQKIENIIKSEVNDYDYGNRRVDPTNTINKSSDFSSPIHISHQFTVRMSKEEILEAWKSHATLQRQAQDKFLSIISKIELALAHRDYHEVPYKTSIWLSQKSI